jgi:hypothetical protein
LEVLWQADDEASLNQALTAFDAAFQTIPDPEKAIKFLNNLLKAAQQVPGLAVELRDGKFLDALIQFGLTASQLNMGAASGDQPLWFFLDTLWNADSAGEIRLGARQLSEFFKEAETPDERLQLVQVSDALLQSVKQSPVSQPPEDQEVYSIPIPGDEVKIAAAAAVPIALGYLAVGAVVGGIAVYWWVKTENDRKEVFRAIVDWTTDTVENVTDRIMQKAAPWLTKLGVAGAKAIQAIRKGVDAAVGQIFKVEGKPLTPDEEKQVERIDEAEGFLDDHPDLAEDVERVKNGEVLPPGRDHVTEAREKVKMLDKAIDTLSRVRRSRNASAQQKIDQAVEKGRRIRQQIKDILRPVQQ